MKGLFVTGSDTHVGKTWVGQHLIYALRKNGIDVIPRKPIESGWDNNDVENTDAWLLANAAGKLDCLDEICPNRFNRPLSPVRAAALEGKTLSISNIKDQCIKSTPPPFYTTTLSTDAADKNERFLYVEGAGGFYSPLCADGLNADLAGALKLPILLVAENRLGCINQVLLTIGAIEQRGLALTAVVLNDVTRNENNDMDNHEDLSNMVDCPVISILHEQSGDIFNELALLVTKHDH